MEEIEVLIKKELDLTNVDQETATKVITTLGGIILQRIFVTILARDEDGTLEKLIEEGKLKEAFEYADENFPYIKEILEAIATEVILEYKAAA